MHAMTGSNVDSIACVGTISIAFYLGALAPRQPQIPRGLSGTSILQFADVSSQARAEPLPLPPTGVVHTPFRAMAGKRGGAHRSQGVFSEYLKESSVTSLGETEDRHCAEHEIIKSVIYAPNTLKNINLYRQTAR